METDGIRKQDADYELSPKPRIEIMNWFIPTNGTLEDKYKDVDTNLTVLKNFIIEFSYDNASSPDKQQTLKVDKLTFNYIVSERIFLLGFTGIAGFTKSYLSLSYLEDTNQMVVIFNGLTLGVPGKIDNCRVKITAETNDEYPFPVPN